MYLSVSLLCFSVTVFLRFSEAVQALCIMYGKRCSCLVSNNCHITVVLYVAVQFGVSLCEGLASETTQRPRHNFYDVWGIRKLGWFVFQATPMVGSYWAASLPTWPCQAVLAYLWPLDGLLVPGEALFVENCAI